MEYPLRPRCVIVKENPCLLSGFGWVCTEFDDFVADGRGISLALDPEFFERLYCSSGVLRVKSSRGIGCACEPDVRLSQTYPSVHLVLLLLVNPLGLHQEQGMVEQEHHKIRVLALRAPSPLEWTLVHEFAVLVFQTQVLNSVRRNECGARYVQWPLQA